MDGETDSIGYLHIGTSDAEPHTWTDERIETLKKLWADGLTANQIAAELGGLTRNAVIGKVHRIGLGGRRVRIGLGGRRGVVAHAPRKQRMDHLERRIRRAIEKTKAKAQVLTAVGEAFVTPVTELTDLKDETPRNGVTFLDLDAHHCRWPYGDPVTPEFLFCGNHALIGFPYCAGHARRAYSPVQRRRY